MSARPTKLHQLREKVIDECFLALEGEMILVEGQPLIVDGKPLMKRPSAATLNIVRQLLKDNGIDREAVEAPAKVITDELPFADPETLSIQQVRQLAGPPSEDSVPFDE